MNNLKKASALLASMLFLFATLASADAAFVAGTYEGTSPSMHGDLTVQIELSDDSLIAVNVIQCDDTAGVYESAVERVTKDMIDCQRIDVDSVAGATVTSRAIMRAVKNAFSVAGADPRELISIEKVAPEWVDQTIDTEVVIIGGGGAGLSAAITAAEHGAKVAIIEKMPRLGGATLVCGAYMNAYIQEDFEAAGMLEGNTLQDYINYTYDGGNQKGDIDLVTKLIAESGATYKWMVDDIGVEFYDWGAVFGHMPTELNGIGIIRPMIQKAYDLGVEVYLDTKAEELLVTDGTVTGVRASRPDGTLLVHASKGVILTTGGFGANMELIHQLDGRYDSVNLSTNPVSSTGEGFELARAIGADFVNFDSVQAVPFAYPGTGEVDYGLDTANTIFVNSNGQRFMDEESKRDVAVAAIQAQDSDIYYSVGDAKDWPTRDTINGFNYTIAMVMDRGRGVCADSLEELAAKIHVDPEALIATVNEYNAMIDAGEDTAFGRADMAKRQKIDTAPFYAAPRTIAIHYANGGVKINTNAQVIDTDGNVINHFYAAGECTGGVMGTNRMGGNGVLDAMVYGRVAGAAAAAN